MMPLSLKGNSEVIVLPAQSLDSGQSPIRTLYVNQDGEGQKFTLRKNDRTIVPRIASHWQSFCQSGISAGLPSRTNVAGFRNEQGEAYSSLGLFVEPSNASRNKNEQWVAVLTLDALKNVASSIRPASGVFDVSAQGNSIAGEIEAPAYRNPIILA